jgi:hypothetical protein
MKHLVLLLGVTAVLAWLPSPAGADWFDDMESYPLGSGLHGQGGWMGWDDDVTWDAYVSDFVSYSPSQSVEIGPTADIVQSFSGYTSDCWVFTAWQYIPTSFSGQTYFLLLNTYNAGGPYNWSCQVLFDSAGFIESYPEGTQLGLITGQWVELRVEIDLDIDVQTFYYDGEMLYQKSWVEGASGGGEVNIGCVDLFGNNASPVYYDDLSLEPCTPTAVDETSWGGIKSLFR